jgi:hypothetical protein
MGGMDFGGMGGMDGPDSDDDDDGLLFFFLRSDDGDHGMIVLPFIFSARSPP